LLLIKHCLKTLVGFKKKIKNIRWKSSWDYPIKLTFKEGPMGNYWQKLLDSEIFYRSKKLYFSTVFLIIFCLTYEFLLLFCTTSFLCREVLFRDFHMFNIDARNHFVNISFQKQFLKLPLSFYHLNDFTPKVVTY